MLLSKLLSFTSWELGTAVLDTWFTRYTVLNIFSIWNWRKFFDEWFVSPVWSRKFKLGTELQFINTNIISKISAHYPNPLIVLKFKQMPDAHFSGLYWKNLLFFASTFFVFILFYTVLPVLNKYLWHALLRHYSSHIVFLFCFNQLHNLSLVYVWIQQDK